MGKYELLLTAHVLAAVSWVGGALMVNLVTFRLRNNPAAAEPIVRQLEWLGLRFFTPLSIIVLAAGILLVPAGDWDFGAPWVSYGFAGFLASFAIGAGFLGPQSGRLARLLAEQGAETPAARAAIARLTLVARLDALLLLSIVAVMALKPGL